MNDTSSSHPEQADALFWKRKLAAFLHDSPSKCLDIKTHEERAIAAFHRAGFTDNEVGFYDFAADHLASAADRFPFPDYQRSKLACTFDGWHNGFHHPLGNTQIHFSPFPSVQLGEEIEQNLQPVLHFPADWSELEVRRARYFAHWRLWRSFAANQDFRFGYLPADTRIPDHSIWNHMQVVSALSSCREGENLRPAFLKIHLGGVQEFISQSRTTRDLWSGSYLMSWLMANGLKKLSELAGPDAVVYPDLKGQPIFDFLWKEEIWTKISIGNHSVWESIRPSYESLLTPNLVNVCLAVVPAARARFIAAAVVDEMKAEWRKIADSVWNFADHKQVWENWKTGYSRNQIQTRWQQQVESNLPHPSWQILHWPDTLQEAVDLAKQMPSASDCSLARLQSIREVAEKFMPQDHRDKRFYEDASNTTLHSPALAWSVILDYCSWLLDASRQLRPFQGSEDIGGAGVTNNKDALNGRDTAIAGGQDWSSQMSKLGDPWKKIFRHNDWLGAVTFIKRVWPYAYLEKEWKLNLLPMPNTLEMAAHDTQGDDNEDGETSSQEGGYFAILALDGDSMGQWISGALNPTWKQQLADYSVDGADRGAVGYFQKIGADSFLSTPRAVTPSFHLQFSETLSNFSLFCAGRIVQAHHGKLIYAGGDDVLAMLPADTALACAEDLQCVFRGCTAPHSKSVLTYINPDGAEAYGFMVLSEEQRRKPNHPVFLVPGPRASASIGIAIAHCKAPLQDVVKAAQQAEKKAKAIEGKRAVCIKVYKRSGEISTWTGRFSDPTNNATGPQEHVGGVELLQAIAQGLSEQWLSAKFPHRLIELLNPYLPKNRFKPAEKQDLEKDFSPQEVARIEMRHVLSRQHGEAWGQWDTTQADYPQTLEKLFTAYTSSLKPELVISNLIDLLTVAAFLQRQS